MCKRSIVLMYPVLLVIAIVSLGGCCITSYPFQDNFSAPPIKCQYRKFDERVVDSYQIVGGHLEITASEDQDLWGGYTGGGPRKRGAPLLLIDAPTSYYEAEAFVTATNTVSPGGPQALNTQVGLFVFRDIDNWMFFGLTNHDLGGTVGDGLIATVTYNGVSSIHHQWVDEPDEDALYLKLKQYGAGGFDTRYELKYKVNQSDAWIAFAWTIHFPNPGGVSEEVGMGVKTLDLAGSGVSNPGLGLFDDFRVYTY